MNETGPWSEVRCLDEGADSEQVRAVSTQVRVCAVIGW